MVYFCFSYICFWLLFIANIKPSRKKFNIKSQKVIWFQIPGFSENHLSLLKLSGKSTNQKLSFEKGQCFGKIWRYNLFNLRPSSFEGFMTQMTGRKSLKSNCTDFTKKPFGPISISKVKILVF